jgi:hypothetical protein
VFFEIVEKASVSEWGSGGRRFESFRPDMSKSDNDPLSLECSGLFLLVSDELAVNFSAEAFAETTLP